MGSYNGYQVAVVRQEICRNACRERPMRVEVWADRKSILDQSLDWVYCMLNSFLSTPHDLFLLSCSHLLPFICVWTEWRSFALQKPDRCVSPTVREVIIVWGKWRQTSQLKHIFLCYHSEMASIELDNSNNVCQVIIFPQVIPFSCRDILMNSIRIE